MPLQGSAIPQLIEHLHDPRLDPYRCLKERELARDDSQRFIAEGEHIVRRLLASDFGVDSILLAHRRVEGMLPAIRPDIPLYTASDDLLQQIIGYKFHSGIIACGKRRPTPSLSDIVPLTGTQGATLLVCADLNSVENLGGIIRTAAGLGVTGILLGEQSCDPFFRRCIRVSMGTIFHLPLRQSPDLAADLRQLAAAGYELTATVIDRDAQPLHLQTRPHRLALLMGSEAQGLDEATLKLCQRKVTIPMHWDTDSLNVGIATAICLYHYLRVAGER